MKDYPIREILVELCKDVDEDIRELVFKKHTPESSTNIFGEEEYWYFLRDPLLTVIGWQIIRNYGRKYR